MIYANMVAPVDQPCPAGLSNGDYRARSDDWIKETIFKITDGNSSDIAKLIFCDSNG